MNDIKREFNFPKFEDIPVSTKTFIIVTNVCFNMNKLYEQLPITNYTVVPKKRGRKRKILNIDPNKDIADGSIITIDDGVKLKGVRLKAKKKNSKSIKAFRNATTIVMIIDGKKINFKITRNGKFQMTGCKKDEHAQKCVQYIWDYIKDNKEVYSINNDETKFKALFVPAMRNIDFVIGFNIDREKLDEWFNSHDYNSLYEPSIGYTGVNIKLKVKKSLLDLKLKSISFDLEKKSWLDDTIVNYKTYLDTLKPKDREKKLEKEMYNTFLVFHSGKCIVSSKCADLSRDSYYDFIDIIKENYSYFEEILE
jgi:TATA-box binding protein (TBP) (component of TFIID and TFIIIB)